MRIAVILPSRGLVFSETVEELLENLKLSDYDYDIYWAHGRPIPECFNEPTEQALKNLENTHFWFVEEDMVLPIGTLEEMLAQMMPEDMAVACDYPVSGEGHYGTMMYDTAGTAFFSGTGCLLVKREALVAMQKPIFRSDLGFDIQLRGECLIVEPYKRTKKQQRETYGFQDIYVGIQLYLAGTPIRVCEVELAQRKLKALGEERKNIGYHDIYLLRGIKKNVFMVLNKKAGVKDPSFGMIKVKTTEGDVMNVREPLALKMLDAGTAEYAEDRVGNMIILKRELL